MNEIQKAAEYQRLMKALTTSAGGIMAGGQFDEFFSKVVDSQPILSLLSTVKVSKPTMAMHYWAAATRLLRLADTTNGYTASTVTGAKNTLTPTRCGFSLPVTYDQLRDMITAPNAEETIQTLMAQIVGQDIVDLAGNGDSSTAGFLITNSGFPVLAAADSSVNDYAATNATYLGSTGVLKNMAALMPEQYLGGAAFFVARSEFETILEEMGVRATSLGDEVMKNGGPIYWHGHPIYAPYAWPVDKTIMTNPKNLFVGMWQEITVQSINKPDFSRVDFVAECAVDYGIAVGAATVYGVTS